MLTCIDAKGVSRWTVSPNQLFSEMKSDYFLKTKVKGEIIGRTLVLTVEDCGILGFDIDSGRKLWELKSE
jgi:hypothetical protein